MQMLAFQYVTTNNHVLMCCDYLDNRNSIFWQWLYFSERGIVFGVIELITSYPQRKESYDQYPCTISWESRRSDCVEANTSKKNKQRVNDKSEAEIVSLQ